MSFNPGQFAINMLNQNPQVANNPRAQELLQVIQNGDSAKGDQIAQLRTEIQQKDLAASQCAQNAYLIQQLRPAAIPAFNVPNPYANYGYGCYCNSANGC